MSTWTKARRRNRAVAKRAARWNNSLLALWRESEREYWYTGYRAPITHARFGATVVKFYEEWIVADPSPLNPSPDRSI